jgi:peptide/nickel transport system permease protein
MKSPSHIKKAAQQFFASWINTIGFVVVIFLFFVALTAPLIANNKPYYYVDHGKTTFPILEDVPFVQKYFKYPEYTDTDFRALAKQPGEHLLLPPIPFSSTEIDLDSTLIPPGKTHYMGTDEQGRDIAARMVLGSQISLSVGFVAVAIYVIIGIIIGAIAGYFGGTIDMIISRIMEIVMCFPTFFLILAVLGFIGHSLFNIMVVIGLTSWTGIARLVRGEFLKLRGQEFVLGVRALGASTPRIIFKHILPNAFSPVMVAITFGIASAILIESSLSFLGFGVQPPTPSWGDILSQSRDFMDIAWWLMFFPGVAIFVTILAFNVIGEGLRDVLDPKS